MASKALPSQEVLRQLLTYDHETGKLYWLPRPACFCTSASEQARWNKRFAGKEALIGKDQDGYLRGTVLSAHVRAHCVAWALHYGAWPEFMLDHENGVRDDNRISNLRPATALQNMWNRKPKSGGTSRFKGVTWHKRDKKWMATIRLGGKARHLGLFDNEEDAAMAYDKQAAAAHGDFARTNGLI